MVVAPKIVEVKIIWYESCIIPYTLLLEQLMYKDCDTRGELVLELREGLKLSQKGPYLIPPINWLFSFDKRDTFKLICEVR